MGSETTSWLAFDISLLVVFVPFALWAFVNYRRYKIVARQFTVLRWSWLSWLFWLAVHVVLLFAVFLWYRDEQPKAEYDAVLAIVHADIAVRALLPFVFEWGAPNVDASTGMVVESPKTTRNALLWTVGALFIIVVFGWINFGLAAAAKAATATWVLWLVYAVLVSVGWGFAIYMAATYPTAEVESLSTESSGSIQKLAQRRSRRS